MNYEMLIDYNNNMYDSIEMENAIYMVPLSSLPQLEFNKNYCKKHKIEYCQQCNKNCNKNCNTKNHNFLTKIFRKIKKIIKNMF